MKRKNDEAIFFGCGPSILDLDDSFWGKTKNYDTWASNNFIIHDFVPDFYHLEIKRHRNGDLLNALKKTRGKDYRKTQWLIDKTRPYILDFMNKEWHKNIYYYAKKHRKSCNGNYRPNPKYRSVSCVASLSLILDAMYNMGYKKVYLIGVDMYSSRYFWTDNPRYKNHPIPNIMKTCKPDERKPDSKHPTAKMCEFIKQFSEFNNFPIINLSNKSLLKDYIGVGKL